MSERFDARRARIGDPSLFPDVSADAYLNFAAVSPPSVLVQQAVHRMLLEYATEGVGAVMEVIEEREGLRGLLARLIGAEPEDIGFVTNTSAGVSAVALCMPWSAGDRICLSYTSDAADDKQCVDLGGARIMQKQTPHNTTQPH